MAEAVVDPLEVVDVDQQQAQGRAALLFKVLLQAADKGQAVAQAGEAVAKGQALDALLGALALADVFVDADVVGQLAVFAMHLGDRQLAPVGVEVLPPALEFALPAVAVAEAGLRIEQQVGEVLQRRQIGHPLAADFLGAVQGDGGKARVDVFHPAVAVDQQKGAGALLDRTLEQVQGAGGGAPLLVDHDLGELVGQLAGKGDFIGLPGAQAVGVFQAEHADHVAVDADAGVEQRLNAHGLQVMAAQLMGARVLLGVVGIDGAAALQGFQVNRKLAGLDGGQALVLVEVAAIQGQRLQMFAL